ncbi:hypothetical protein DW322_11290 [Rhodococcus rhodnii]|uniref:Major tail protein n=2 Tax=Rhodococcus rhodnii TaxID=38312 RepID=R7WS01_9NOCA|nr:hypothetical protein [Rhodococcus rhodnii]EOM78098.1 hypothetical protein Rrhod_0548 [Rhodococcus rhodnii LMG 5362]TXG90695.1 hypothetical protein DW322_11290 [Rhodococcus rhodnii]
MSTHANPEKAFVWLDGDVYRAPAGTAIPTDPFANAPVTGSTPGVTWDPFGGIEAGFELNPTQDLTPLPVWNRRSATYKLVKGVREDRFKFRAVDYSVATALTALQGGTITEVGTAPNQYFQWEPGDDEEFALLLLLRDEDDTSGFFCKRVTLATPPPRVFGGETLDGFEFEVLCLDKVVPVTSWNPLEA